MNSKIQKMNAWRKELSAKGVKAPRSASYEKLRSLHKKHCGCGGSSRASSSSATVDTDLQKQQTDYFLWGWH